MRFTKLHGTGNDFLIIDARDLERNWEALAVAMCERHFGVGADGLIIVEPSDDADVRMRLFNADGSEAEMSGNGLRCFVKYVIERGLVHPREGAVTVETLAGVLTTLATIEGGRVEAVRVGMGQPRFAPAEIPVAIEAQPPVLDHPLEVDGHPLALTFVSMGNPHAVHFIEAPVEGFPLETVGPKVERHRLFPKRVNFGVARVLGRDRMDVRVWERGVGETLACGTGVSAAVVAARLHGYVDDAVEVQQPGGLLVVEWDGEGEVYLTGPAVEVFEGEWPEDEGHGSEVMGQ